MARKKTTKRVKKKNITRKASYRHHARRHISEWERKKAEGRALYEAADRAMLRAIEKMEPDEVVVSPHSGKSYKISDNFENANVAFRPAAVRRFELKEVRL